jgi:hypothetical protein
MARKAYGLRDYEHESYICPNGNELYLPSKMKFSICHLCRTPAISPEADPVTVAGATRYLDRGWIRWRSGYIDSRPVCTICQNAWRIARRAQHVAG